MYKVLVIRLPYVMITQEASILLECTIVISSIFSDSLGRHIPSTEHHDGSLCLSMVSVFRTSESQLSKVPTYHGPTNSWTASPKHQMAFHHLGSNQNIPRHSSSSCILLHRLLHSLRIGSHRRSPRVIQVATVALPTSPRYGPLSERILDDIPFLFETSIF